FYFFKTFTGIVRHTTLNDAINLFKAAGLAFITLYISNSLAFLILKERFFLNTRLLIACVLVYGFLLFFRISIKILFDFFEAYSSNPLKLDNAVIYGDGERAIAVANALNAESPKRFKLKGFINPKLKNSDKRILNLPVIGKLKKTSVLVRSLGGQILILADNNLSKEDKLEIVEDCINYNIKVYNLPSLTDINDQKIISSNIRKIKIEDLLERKPIVINNNEISNQLNNKVVLISGAAGSIGSEIAWQVANFN